MKKLYPFPFTLLTFILLFLSPFNKAYSQDVLFSEDFSGLTEFPADWSVVGSGTENWNILPENFAGGEAPEIYMNFSPAFDGNSKLVTPPINTSGNTHLLLVYNQLLANYSSSGDESIKVETTSDGTTWNEVWFSLADTDFGPVVNELTIDNTDVGSENFQIAFTFEGNSDNINWWNIDNIVLTEMPPNDVAAIGIGLPGSFSIESTQIPKASVRNYGFVTAEFDVTLSINDGNVDVYTSTQTVSGLGTLEEVLISFDSWTPSTIGEYTVTATTLLAGDENTVNDVFTKLIEVVDEFYFIESFDGGVFPPEGWTIVGDEINNWYESTSNFAGGDIPEAAFGWDPVFEGTSRLISPEINTGDLDNLLLSFKQYLDDYAGGYTLKVQTTSDAGNTWNDVWTNTVTSDIEPEIQLIPFSNADVGEETFQIAFVFEGNSYNIWNWYVDDLELTEGIQFDVSAGSIFGVPSLNPIGAEILPSAFVNNYGFEEASFDVMLTINNGTSDIFTSVVNASDVPLIDDEEVTFDSWIATEVGDYTISVETLLPTDENLNNNISTFDFSVIEGVYRNMVVMEDFTGTWCTFCPAAQMGIRDLIGMGYPVAGIGWHSEDIFETAESEARIAYYEVFGLPTVMADGVQDFQGGSPDSSAVGWYAPFVDERMEYPTTVAIDLNNVNFDGSTFTATVDMEAVGLITSEDLVLHAVLTESHVPYEWITQYELLEIQRLTFAGSEGTSIDLINQTSQSVDISFTLDSEWIPEFCEVVVFVQDKITRDIFNGNKVHVKEQTEWPSITVNVHDVNGNAIENASVEFGTFLLETGGDGQAVFSDLDAGSYFYNVTAADYLPFTNGVFVVTIEDEIIDIELNGTTNINELTPSILSLYPNPANDHLIINGFDNAKVFIYDLAGKLRSINELTNGIPIDISGLNQGSYLVKVVDGNKAQTGKVTIIR